jgi:hypothetical protein
MDDQAEDDIDSDLPSSNNFSVHDLNDDDMLLSKSPMGTAQKGTLVASSQKGQADRSTLSHQKL